MKIKILKKRFFILEDNMIIVGLEGNILLDIAFEDETCESVIKKKMELKNTYIWCSGISSR